jgi:hypothetical protein
MKEHFNCPRCGEPLNDLHATCPNCDPIKDKSENKPTNNDKPLLAMFFAAIGAILGVSYLFLMPFTGKGPFLSIFIAITFGFDMLAAIQFSKANMRLYSNIWLGIGALNFINFLFTTMPK